jgi:Niemann-Pick C1 protein
VLQQDVVYPVMSQRAMTFVGGGAQNYSEWFAFLGLVKVCAVQQITCQGQFRKLRAYELEVKGERFSAVRLAHIPPQDKRVPKTGSPFQMNFPAEDETPSGMAPLNGSMPTCWDSAQRCSCGDCPDAPRCLPVQAAVRGCKPANMCGNASQFPPWQDGQQELTYMRTQ